MDWRGEVACLLWKKGYINNCSQKNVSQFFKVNFFFRENSFVHGPSYCCLSKMVKKVHYNILQCILRQQIEGLGDNTVLSWCE